LTNISAQTAMITTMVAVFIGIVSAFAIAHRFSHKNKKNGDLWLFSHWQQKLYDSFFSAEPEIVAKKLGVDSEKHLKNCKLCKIEPRLKEIVMNRITGYTVIVLFVLMALFTRSWLLIVPGLFISLPLISYIVYTANQQMSRRKQQITDELPRYLDMLQTALAIDMPVDQAIEITCRNLSDTIISAEMMSALADSRLGVSSWQDGLERLALEYDIDTLSDFALDLVNAYNNGSSIIESVSRKSRDTKHANLLAMKEKASRLTSTILFPVLIFKIFPLLAILCIPVISQLNSSGWGL